MLKHKGHLMLRNLCLSSVVYIVLITGCASTPSTNAPSMLSVPPVEGTATSEILTDEKLTREAIAVAEKYWNAQKKADATLFRSVTPHESMNVVFDWSYVNKANILLEHAPTIGIKQHIQQFLEHHRRYKSLPSPSTTSMAEIKAASIYAGAIAMKYPMLGDLLTKAYWDSIIPANFQDYSSYKLMNFRYVADVKAQSRAGTILQKRATLLLYRMVADNQDSGWKVLFVEGLHSLPSRY